MTHNEALKIIKQLQAQIESFHNLLQTLNKPNILVDVKLLGAICLMTLLYAWYESSLEEHRLKEKGEKIDKKSNNKISRTYRTFASRRTNIAKK